MEPDFELLEKKFDFSQDVIRLFWKKYGTRTKHIIEALKRPCEKYAIRINTLKTTSSEVIDLFNELDIIAEPHPKFNDVIFLPVTGPFLVPEYKKRVVVDKFTAESLIQGADLFAPGVLRASKIRKDENVTITDKQGKILASGVAKMTAKDMLQLKHGLAVKIVNSIYKIVSIRELEMFKRGEIFDQSFPSIIVSKVLDPELDDSIIDLCTAPGGKATHIAQLMDNTGKILAIDRSRPRLKRLNEHITRLGITNIRTLHANSRNLSEEYNCWADRILIDPPCSALGVRPKIRDDTTKKEIINVANYQRQFIKAAARYIKPSGIIVYCTCTLTNEENEENIKFLIDNYDCKILEQKYFFGSPGEKCENLRDYQKLQRFYPDLHDTPGYFIAKLQMQS